MKLADREIKILKQVSLASGLFTVVIALTMLFSLLQLKIINPLDNPIILEVKQQYDANPSDPANAERVRAIDLMARKAYFSARWQVETGSYLMLAGAIIFVLCQRLISGSEKINPSFPAERNNISAQKERNRRYLIISAAVITAAAIISSFILRSELPDTGKRAGNLAEKSKSKSDMKIIEADPVNFPTFRGKGSRGIAGGKGYPVEWDGGSGKNIKWKLEIPKLGKSSPVIWEDKIFVTGAEGTDCEVFCIDKEEGKILWTGKASGFPGSPDIIPESDPDAGMAVSTMAVDGKYACAVFGNGNLVCFDHEGNLKWAKNLGVPQSIYGYSSSLIIYENIVIVQYDSDEKVSLMGFDTETGDQKWETIRNGRPVWCSPVLAAFDGKPQIMINGNPDIAAYDPLTGKLMWSVPGLTGDVAPSLAYNSKLVYAVTDYAKLIAVTPGISAPPVWEDNAYTPDVSSPAANDNYIFLTTGNGDVACYDAMKGDTLWTRYFINSFYASPIICDDKVWMLDRSGMMHITAADKDFKLFGTPTLGEVADCTPAFSDGKIYIRAKKNLYCISGN